MEVVAEKRPELVPLDETMTVCFVCTGNTCRSPMAAAVLNYVGGGHYKAFSAGISAAVGEPISENSVLALKEAGIPETEGNAYSKHRAMQICSELVERSDKIVAISKRHAMALLYAFPEYADKITVMPTDISDPFMQSKEVYRICLDEITKGIKELFAI